MTNRTLLAAVVAVLAATASPAAGQSLTGTWQLESQTRRGTQTMTLALVQDGSDLTGTVTMTMGGRRGGGGGGAGARTLEIEDGHVDGSSFGFTYALAVNGNSMIFEMSGTFEGDGMEGTIGGGRGGGRPFTGTRGG